MYHVERTVPPADEPQSRSTLRMVAWILVPLGNRVCSELTSLWVYPWSLASFVLQAGVAGFDENVW